RRPTGALRHRSKTSSRGSTAGVIRILGVQAASLTRRAGCPACQVNPPGSPQRVLQWLTPLRASVRFFRGQRVLRQEANRRKFVRFRIVRYNLLDSWLLRLLYPRVWVNRWNNLRFPTGGATNSQITSAC